MAVATSRSACPRRASPLAVTGWSPVARRTTAPSRSAVTSTPHRVRGRAGRKVQFGPRRLRSALMASRISGLNWSTCPTASSTLIASLTAPGRAATPLRVAGSGPPDRPPPDAAGTRASHRTPISGSSLASADVRSRHQHETLAHDVRRRHDDRFAGLEGGGRARPDRGRRRRPGPADAARSSRARTRARRQQLDQGCAVGPRPAIRPRPGEVPALQGREQVVGRSAPAEPRTEPRGQHAARGADAAATTGGHRVESHRDPRYRCRCSGS